MSGFKHFLLEEPTSSKKDADRCQQWVIVVSRSTLPAVGARTNLGYRHLRRHWVLVSSQFQAVPRQIHTSHPRSKATQDRILS